jgi:hypothetical protein
MPVEASGQVMKVEPVVPFFDLSTCMFKVEE